MTSHDYSSCKACPTEANPTGIARVIDSHDQCAITIP